LKLHLGEIGKLPSFPMDTNDQFLLTRGRILAKPRVFYEQMLASTIHVTTWEPLWRAIFSSGSDCNGKWIYFWLRPQPNSSSVDLLGTDKFCVPQLCWRGLLPASLWPQFQHWRNKVTHLCLNRGALRAPTCYLPSAICLVWLQHTCASLFPAAMPPCPRMPIAPMPAPLATNSVLAFFEKRMHNPKFLSKYKHFV